MISEVCSGTQGPSEIFAIAQKNRAPPIGGKEVKKKKEKMQMVRQQDTTWLRSPR
jgi:hypothetical protein